MMRKLHKIDAEGFLIFGEDLFINEDEQVPKGYTNVLLDTRERGFYRPQLVNGKWIEAKTEDEFLEDEFLASLKPNQKEIEKAARELESVELLIELGVI